MSLFCLSCVLCVFVARRYLCITLTCIDMSYMLLSTFSTVFSNINSFFFLSLEFRAHQEQSFQLKIFISYAKWLFTLIIISRCYALRFMLNYCECASSECVHIFLFALPQLSIIDFLLFVSFGSEKKNLSVLPIVVRRL